VVVGVGLGALLATSATAFVVVKWAGVAYLVYLGVQQWRAPVRPLAEMQAGAASVRRRDLVLRGLLINIVNPKGTVFLLAVVPQFLTLSQPLTPQYLVIAATLGFTDLTVMAGYTALAAKVLGTLKSARAMKWTNRTFGGLFVAAGALLSVFKRTA
jgi:homoserine/homoserine lactone efflux protein